MKEMAKIMVRSLHPNLLLATAGKNSDSFAKFSFNMLKYLKGLDKKDKEQLFGMVAHPPPEPPTKKMKGKGRGTACGRGISRGRG